MDRQDLMSLRSLIECDIHSSLRHSNRDLIDNLGGRLNEINNSLNDVKQLLTILEVRSRKLNK